MGFPKQLTLIITSFFLIFTSPIFSQIVFHELPAYEMKISDSVFFDITSTRRVIPLNGTWKVYPADKKESEKASVKVPSIFKGEGELVFEKNFSLSEFQISNFKMKLFFLGVNYTADISVNNIIIFRHTGGEFPFNLDLPRDILHADKENILSVKLFYQLDSENTIPVKQRFLFPQNYGGILRDVYIHLIPNISISDMEIAYNYDPNSKKAKVDIHSRIDNKEFRSPADTLVPANEFRLRLSLSTGDETTEKKNTPFDFKLDKNKERIITQQIDMASPFLWSPSSPQSYLVKLELWRGENLIDATRDYLSIYSLTSLKDSLLFNGNNFEIEGVTYVPSSGDFGSLINYDKMEEDIRLIKNTGFNTVKFSKSVPHPYYLNLCEKYGLLAFLEIPVDYIPGAITSDQNFIARSRSYLTNFLKAYKKYSVFAAVGLGSSYLPSSEHHKALIADLAETAQKNIKAITYASFSGFNIEEIDNLDLYGVELFNKSIINDSSAFKNLQANLGTGKVFISEAAYIVNSGNTNGYVNQYSFEAQAKFFEELLEFSESIPLAGYFIHTMFDYRGDFSSLVYGYNEKNIYNIGIAGEDRNTSRLSYKILQSRLHNEEKVTIPIGSKKDDSPMIFIVFGLVLALIMGVLVNSGKKFREDSSRALLRPYNFFADIRDQRMISGIHSTILAIVVSMVSALIVSNLLFYLKTSVLFERLLLSFGSTGLIKVVSYLAWNPLSAVIWLSIVFFVLIFVLTIVIRLAAFFVRHRVYISNVYFVSVWSFLPFVLLIPVGIILYRLLNAEAANIYVYLGLIVFCLWVYYRLLKGIHVIYDVNPGGVYFYSNIVLLLTILAVFLYFEIKNSAIDYLLLTLKQYNIL